MQDLRCWTKCTVQTEAANNVGNSLVPDAVNGAIGVTVVGGTRVMNGVQVVGSFGEERASNEF